MKKYLNKNVRFKCENGNAVWFKPLNGAFIVRINGAEALLNNCSLSLIGPPRLVCNLTPNPSTGTPPGLCAASVIAGSWNDSVRLEVGSNSVLSSRCSIRCPCAGGLIKPFKPTITALNVDDAAMALAVSIDRRSAEGNCGDTDGGTDTHSETEFNSETESHSSNEKELGLENRALEEREIELKQENEEKKNKDDVKDVEYALCGYRKCKKASECEYLKASHMPVETNESKNAAELKEYMGRDAFDLYQKDCSAIESLFREGDKYSVAHHHAVPVNQCFKQCPEIVKLANYYKYNINRAENGICLPTMNDGYDNQAFNERKKISFKAMESLGRQWHKGGHEYKIPAVIDSKLENSVKHYKHAVDDELRRFEIWLREEFDCPADNYEQQAAKFTKVMDHICRRITEKLRKFKESPQESYPFFVSKLALYFAYRKELDEYEEDLFGKE